MALSTATTFLNHSADGVAYTKLVDITSYPDLGATPNKLDTTTLSAEKLKTSMLGLQEVPDLTFECNFDPTAYTTISALTGTQYFEIEFSNGGGSFQWQGEVQIFVSGGGVDEVRKMTVVLSAETEIAFVPVA